MFDRTFLLLWRLKTEKQKCSMKFQMPTPKKKFEIIKQTNKQKSSFTFFERNFELLVLIFLWLYGMRGRLNSSGFFTLKISNIFSNFMFIITCYYLVNSKYLYILTNQCSVVYASSRFSSQIFFLITNGLVLVF